MRVCVVHVFRVPIVLHRVAVKAGEFNARRSGRSGGENRRGESAEREDEADFESSVYAHLLGGVRVDVFSRVGGSVADYHHRVGRAQRPVRSYHRSDNRARVLYEFSGDWGEDFGVEN